MYKQSLLGLIAVAFCLLFTSCQVGQEKKALKLNELFTNHIVLQQNEEVAFWGKYTPGEEVTVSGSWGEKATTTAENNGNWTLNLPTPEAGGPFTIKGAIWYQGESNVSRAEQYKKLFPAMIEDWRTQWKNDFPFYFVQIAPYQYHQSPDVSLDKSQKLRDAQRLSLKTKNTGMARLPLLQQKNNFVILKV